MKNEFSLQVELLNLHKTFKPDLLTLKRAADFVVFNELDFYLLKRKIEIFWKRAEFYIHWIDEKAMRELHRKTHKDPSSTDVISMDYWSEISGAEEFVLGEVFVNVDEAKKVWRTQKTSLHFELLLYLVHGVLHVFGCDDRNEADRRAMRERESFYMDLFSHLTPIVKKA